MALVTTQIQKDISLSLTSPEADPPTAFPAVGIFAEYVESQPDEAAESNICCDTLVSLFQLANLGALNGGELVGRSTLGKIWRTVEHFSVKTKEQLSQDTCDRLADMVPNVDARATSVHPQ